MNHYATRQNFETLKSTLIETSNVLADTEGDTHENVLHISNGQMLLKTFPKAHIRNEINCDTDFIEISLDGIVGWGISKEWWNTPYKEEGQVLMTAINQQWEERLDKIVAEIEQVVEEESTEDLKWSLGLKYALKIIDKYRKETE